MVRRRLTACCERAELDEMDMYCPHILPPYRRRVSNCGKWSLGGRRFEHLMEARQTFDMIHESRWLYWLDEAVVRARLKHGDLLRDGHLRAKGDQVDLLGHRGVVYARKQVNARTVRQMNLGRDKGWWLGLDSGERLGC